MKEGENKMRIRFIVGGWSLHRGSYEDIVYEGEFSVDEISLICGIPEVVPVILNGKRFQVEAGLLVEVTNYIMIQTPDGTWENPEVWRTHLPLPLGSS